MLGTERRAEAPKTRILIVTDAKDDEALLDLLAAGVEGLMARGGRARSRATVRELLAGGRPGAPRILELGDVAPDGAAEPALTGRQSAVLRLMAEGLSNKEIARDLGVSPATVKTHVAQLIAILGATNRTDAAMKARSRGLV